MDNIDSKKVDLCLETLCNDGCQSVWGYIDTLAAGRDLPQTSGLSAAEREWVLAELKAIMAVYENR